MTARTIAGVVALLSFCSVGCGSSDSSDEAQTASANQHPAWLATYWSYHQEKTSPFVHISYSFKPDGTGEIHRAQTYKDLPSYYSGSSSYTDTPFRWSFEAPNELFVDGVSTHVEVGPSCAWITIHGLKLAGNETASRAGCPNVGPALSELETALLGKWDFREARGPDGGSRVNVKGTLELRDDRFFSWRASFADGRYASLWGSFSIQDGVLAAKAFDDELVAKVTITGDDMDLCDATGCMKATRHP